MDDRLMFASSMIGKPWVYRASSLECVDCWGLVVLYYRRVLGIELHQVPDMETDKGFLTYYRDNVVNWKKIENPENDGVFVAYVGDEPKHIGIVLLGDALHASGDAGCVRYDKLRAIERKFTRLEYLRYANN